jgi:hypothetical protein
VVCCAVLQWYDWSPPGGGDSLDELVVQRARRAPSEAPYDVFKRAFTPYNKRLEDMEKSPEAALEMFKLGREESRAVALRKYRATSIFGGQQGVAGAPGDGWRKNYGFAKPPPAEQARNAACTSKYQTSNFPSKYEEYCAEEYGRMNRKARGLP